MKTLKIYKREIIERTQFKNYRFKQARQFVVYLGDEVVYTSKPFDNFVTNKRAKNHGSLILETRSPKLAKSYFSGARVNQEEFKVQQAILKRIDK